MRLEKALELLKTNNIFITGGGGVGKSYLCQEIITFYTNNKKNVISLGSTGISAVGIGGITIHRFFAFLICNNLDELIMQDKKNQRNVKKCLEILKITDLLVIDEISMVGYDLMEMINYRLIKSNFKGKIIVLGDFYQLPPIKKTIKDNLFSSTYAFDSFAWAKFDFKVLNLTKSKRTDDLKFFEILNKIRIANIDEECISFLQNLQNNTQVLKLDSTNLFPINRPADILNQQKLNEIKEKSYLYSQEITIYEDKVHPKIIQKWQENLNIINNLELKVGAKVLICANNAKEGYFNGEQAKIVQLDKDEIILEKQNNLINLKRQEYQLCETKIDNEDIIKEVIATINQFPLKLAYAITIHKSQGMGFENLICNLDNCFESGQFYVAISRAKNPKTLLLNTKFNNFNFFLNQNIKTNQNITNFYENTNMINIDL